MLGLLRRRRIKKRSSEFWELIADNDVAGALEFYDANLSSMASHVDRPTRAAYHLHRWTVHRRNEDLEALVLLRAGLDPDDPTARAHATVKQMQRQASLARALASGNPDADIGEPSEGKHFTVRVAQALCEVQQVRGAAAGEKNRRRAAERIESLVGFALSPLCKPEDRAGRTTEYTCPCVGCDQRLKMPAELAGRWVTCPTCSGECQAPDMWPPLETPSECTNEDRITAHLLLWSAMELGKYDLACRFPELLEKALAEDAIPAFVDVAAKRGRSSVIAGHVEEAFLTFLVMQEVASLPQRRRMLLDWGVAAVEADAADAAARWFERQFEHPPPDMPECRPLAALGLSVAYYRTRQVEKAEHFIGTLPELAAAMPAMEEVEGGAALREAVLSQGHFLRALALLAETADWETPAEADSGAGDSDAAAAAERSQGIRVKNSALRAELRSGLTPLIESLSPMPPDRAWKGHLLAGLLAFVDRNQRFPLPAIRAFALAVGHVPEQEARTALKRIEGALVTRAKATEEALRLIERGDHGLLRQFHDTVLAVEGDTIAPPVRAAVAMTLWQGDPTFDPLLELESLARDHGGNEAVERCMSVVRTVQSIAGLCEECARRVPSDSLLPALSAFKGLGEQVQACAALALACQHVRRGDETQGEEFLDQADAEELRGASGYLRFHLAWRSGDLQSCGALADKLGDSPHMPDPQTWRMALAVRMLMRALENQDTDEVAASLQALDASPSTAVLSLVAHLLKVDKPSLAATLLRCVGELPDAGDRERHLGPNAAWTHAFLRGLVSLQQGQITTGTESLGRVQHGDLPDQTVFGGEHERARILGWAKLLCLESELALSAQWEEEAPVRWRTAVRSLQSGAQELLGRPDLANHAKLILGVTSALTSRALVEQETIDGLCEARDALQLSRRTRLMDRLIDDLRRRKRVLDDFWRHVGRSEFEEARLLYGEELVPAFGERIPHSIQLAMVMVDWDASAVSTPDLLRRLGVLEHSAMDLRPELIGKVRDYIVEGDNIRRLISLLKDKQFAELIDMTAQTQWMGMDRGSMPLPVAVVQLYALYKTRRTDEADRMGENMSGAEARYGAWVQDCSSLLLGYVSFEKADYGRAAEAFGRTTGTDVLGHDLNKYRAAAHFSRGQELLAVDSKKEAFDEFARALNKKTGAEAGMELAPLFIHFGLRFVEARHGNRAQRAFGIVGESLKAGIDGPDVARCRLVAKMGELLCEVLTEEDVANLGGERFTALLPRVGEIGDHEKEQAVLKRSLLILAICAELRRQIRLPEKRRESQRCLHKFLNQQSTALAPLGRRESERDPVLVTLCGLTELLVNPRGNSRKALKDLEDAVRLGVHSHKLTELLGRHRERAKKATEQHAEALDIFDSYLADGTVPAYIQKAVARQPDLVELYSMSRRFLPEDIMTAEVASGVENLCSRLEHLAAFVGSGDVEQDQASADLKQRLQAAAERLRTLEQEALEDERKAMETVAERMRVQSLV